MTQEKARGPMNDLRKGKRGLIMGVANDHSIAWGIARALAAQGAELAFTYLAKRAAELMPETGGSIITLTFSGSTRVMPNYNVMGVAKAALEASVRYLAFDFGRTKIRINAISAGPVRTLAGAVIGDSRTMFAFQQKHSPLGRGVSLDELGGSALYLLSDLSTGVTGEIHYVDSGYNIISMPRPEDLKTTD